MKKIYSLTVCLFLLGFTSLFAQFPPLEMSADTLTTTAGGTVDVSVRAGTNWQNITTINGSISFDTTVISWNSLASWGLSFPQNANFTYQGGGVLTWTWTSLITVGPTLSSGDPVFTLRFNVVGAPGSFTNLSFGSNPEPLFWANGFAWSGNNFVLSNGSVNVICGITTAHFGSQGNLNTVTFSDSSSAGATSYLWDFGDGNTSTMTNPTHTYATGGQYTACLTIVDSCGSDSSCQTLTVCPDPTPAFTASNNQLTVNFSDNSSATVTNFFWDFGDGNTSTMQNPTHTYATPGNYMVCLTVTDPCGTDSICQPVAPCLPPAAGFTSQANQLNYTFTDASTLSPTSWFWILGDGNTSTQQSPNHTYALPGNYQVCLIASNACGADTSCQAIVASCPAPVATFTDSISGFAATFTDQSPNSPTSWLWDFGDGVTSTLQNPSHTYTAPGSYLVCLTASSLCGTDSSCTTVTATCPAPVAAFSNTVLGSVATFSDQSTISPTSWAWDFGDGNTSTQQNPVHTYAADGNYQVCLTASSLCGSDVTCDSVTILTVGRPDPELPGLRLYPNPVHDRMHISLLEQANILSVQVLNLQGQVMAQIPGSHTQSMVLDLSGLAQGIYFVEVETANNKFISKILME